MRVDTRLPCASGQTSTEYLLLVSVIVVAVVAGAYVLVPGFGGGTAELASDVSSILDGGSIGGLGHDRAGATVNAAVPSYEPMPGMPVNPGDVELPTLPGNGLGLPAVPGGPANGGGSANPP